MKLRESGMPEEAYWETLFDVGLILERLGVNARLQSVVEFGCGYGTFTVPVAKRISGTVATYDIYPAMVERARGAASGRWPWRQQHLADGLLRGSSRQCRSLRGTDSPRPL